MSQLSFMQQLEAHGDELEVRERLAKGLYNGDHRGIAQEWLRRREEARSVASVARSEARAEESLSISRQALSNSRMATRIALSAIALSIIMAGQKVIEWYSK
jgi:hypothetical protein